MGARQTRAIARFWPHKTPEMGARSTPREVSLVCASKKLLARSSGATFGYGKVVGCRSFSHPHCPRHRLAKSRVRFTTRGVFAISGEPLVPAFPRSQSFAQRFGKGPLAVSSPALVVPSPTLSLSSGDLISRSPLRFLFSTLPHCSRSLLTGAGLSFPAPRVRRQSLPFTRFSQAGTWGRGETGTEFFQAPPRPHARFSQPGAWMSSPGSRAAMSARIGAVVGGSR